MFLSTYIFAQGPRGPVNSRDRLPYGIRANDAPHLQTLGPSIAPDRQDNGTQFIPSLAGQRHCFCVLQCYSSCSPSNRRPPAWLELRCLLADTTAQASAGEHRDVYTPLSGLSAGAQGHCTSSSNIHIATGRVGLYRVSEPNARRHGTWGWRTKLKIPPSTSHFRQFCERDNIQVVVRPLYLVMT